MSPKARRTLVIAVGAVISLSILATSVSLMPSLKGGQTQGYAVHLPIVIAGDGAFTPANGVVRGTGSADDPFVISGWEIMVDAGAGIAISGTTAHFIISDVHVNATAGAMLPQFGIFLSNVANGVVKGSLVNNTQIGIYVELSDNSSVQDNRIRSNSLAAVSLQLCDSVNVVGNDILATNGVRSNTLTNSVIELNWINMSEIAVELANAASVVVQQNTMLSCSYAVMATSASDIVITGNNASQGASGVSYYGIYLTDCLGVNVSGNCVRQSSASGLTTAGTPTNVTFIYNTVSRSNYAGYMVEGADGIVVRENLFENNTYVFAHSGGAVTITSAANTTFFHNNFVTNTPAQAEDPTSTVNMWNETYPTGGNYWSDYSGPDLMSGPLQDIPGSDGMGDVNYSIDADSADSYPLMAPHYINSRPSAFFTLTPSSGSVGETISLNASGSSDPDEGCGDSVKEYRWDLNGDGRWDSGKSSENISSHQYLVPGNYTVILEVTDSHGLTSLYQVRITITETVIPEFAVLVLPVMGAIAIVLLVRARARAGP